MRHRPIKKDFHVYTHFRHRIFERYDLEISFDTWKFLNSKIESRECKCIVTQSLTRKWFLIDIEGKPVYCCWQRGIGICTAITEDQFHLSFRSANGELLSR